MTTTPTAAPSPSELAAMTQTSKPRPTYFFKRNGDGLIFPTSETDANELLRNRGSWMRKDFEYLGMSDGQTYFDHVAKTKQLLQEKREALKVLNTNLTKFIKTQDRLVFEELVDADDEQLKKVEGLIAEKQKEADTLTAEIQEVFTTMHERAFAEELEKAKQNKVLPPNLNIITPMASNEAMRAKIINEIPR